MVNIANYDAGADEIAICDANCLDCPRFFRFDICRPEYVTSLYSEVWL